MRIALVIARYSADIVGGAEALIRDYAEKLTAAGDDVTVLTTCARNHFTWANELPTGDDNVNGVHVRRFSVSPNHDSERLATLQFLIDGGLEISAEDQMTWIKSKGHSEALLDALRTESGNFDVIVFGQYLMAPTVLGAQLVPEKSLIVPCLHDEAYAYFAPIQDALRGCAGLIFNSDAERDFAKRLLGDALPPHRVVGAGFDPPGHLDGEQFRREHNLSQDYIAYAGRREEGKNYPLLVKWTAGYNLGLGQCGALDLAAMGSGDYQVPKIARPYVRDLGVVTEQNKFDALTGAVATVNLSRNESLSYIVLESWLAHAPVIVHADCDVTRRHCEDAGGGLWVDSAETFAAAVDRMRSDPSLRTALANAGQAYAREKYSWSAVMTRLNDALSELVS